MRYRHALVSISGRSVPGIQVDIETTDTEDAVLVVAPPCMYIKGLLVSVS